MMEKVKRDTWVLNLWAHGGLRVPQLHPAGRETLSFSPLTHCSEPPMSPHGSLNQAAYGEGTDWGQKTWVLVQLDHELTV